MKTVILGHMSPDADSILSAIAMQDLMTKRGMDCQAYAQGKPTLDTQWVLDKFGFDAPEIIASVKERDVVLVDTTNTTELPKDINEATIKMVVDHHNLGQITTSSPLEMWVRPVGCCGTIIKEIYESDGQEIPEKIAGILLAAILNDTLIFKSPTTTPADTKAAKGLAKIAKIDDLVAFGREMFVIKSNVDDTPENLLFRDFKNKDINGKSFGIGQLELMGLDTIESKKSALLEEMKKAKEEKEFHTVILMLTDLIDKGTELLVVSNDEAMIEKAFNTKIENNISVFLEGVLSRKKQISPPLMDVN